MKRYNTDDLHSLLFAICVSNGITEINIDVNNLNRRPKGTLSILKDKRTLNFIVDFSCLDLSKLDFEKLKQVVSAAIGSSSGGFTMNNLLRVLQADLEDHRLKERIGLALSRLGYTRSTRTKKGNKREYLYTRKKAIP
jgi:hypothetical protein